VFWLSNSSADTQWKTAKFKKYFFLETRETQVRTEKIQHLKKQMFNKSKVAMTKRREILDKIVGKSWTISE
jgi:hypothetical protein